MTIRICYGHQKFKVFSFFAEFNHYGTVSEMAAELKKLAKKSNESRYVLDQRKK